MAASVLHSALAVGSPGSAVTSISSTAFNSTAGSSFFASCCHDPAVTATISDNKSNSYTLVGTFTQGIVAVTIWWCGNGNGGSGHQVTFGFSSATYPSGTFVEIADSGNTLSLDSASAGNSADTSSPYTVTSGTFDAADTLALLSFAFNAASGVCTYSESTGMTQLAGTGDSNNYWSGAVFSKALSGTSPITPSVTQSGAGSPAGMAMYVVGIKSTSGGGSDVTLDLTGNAATGDVGSVTASVALNVTGVAAVGDVGTVSASIDATLSGTAGSGAVGTVTSGIAKALTGNAGTGAAGTVTSAIGEALSGNSATGDVGTVSPAVDLTLSGAQGDGAVGDVTPSTGGDVTLSLTGVAATGDAGSVSASVGLSVAGVAGTGAVGTVARALAIGLVGNSATGDVGSVTATGGDGPSPGPGFPGIDVGTKKPARKPQTAHFKPILQRKLDEKAARLVRPAQDRAAARAKAIEREAAAAAADPATTDAEMLAFLARWKAERPVIPFPLVKLDPMELFLAQVAFRMFQAQQAQAQALEQQRAQAEAEQRRRRQNDDALIAILLP